MIIINPLIAVRSHKYNNYSANAKYPPITKVGEKVVREKIVKILKMNNYLEFKFLNREDFNKVPDMCEILLRFEEGWKTASMYQNIKIIERFKRSKIIVLQFEVMLGHQYDYNQIMRKSKIEKIIE